MVYENVKCPFTYGMEYIIAIPTPYYYINAFKRTYICIFMPVYTGCSIL